MLSMVKFCNGINRFFPIKHFPLSNPGNKIDQLRRMLLAADSSGCYIAANAYEDQLAVFCVNDWKISWLFSVSMTGNDIIDKMIIGHSKSEGTECIFDLQKTRIYGTIWSMCFISLDSGQPSKELNPLFAIILQSTTSDLLILRLVKVNSDRGCGAFCSEQGSSVSSFASSPDETETETTTNFELLYSRAAAKVIAYGSASEQDVT
ncbi:Protein OSB1, mitochondrial isoform J [Glycine soja]|uniref:Protein OSB1, mitochondrial isoform J n=1 Tax=Glycine soja TaxID=3848 RepID=A0A445H364_GLYSO|nr:Protein OSB1, mitochondrial isoform J [Glycine soja]